jgi:hypothetical protein
VTRGGDDAGAGACEQQQEGAERLGEQPPPLQVRALEAVDPPGVAREVPAGRPLVRERQLVGASAP